MSKRFVFAMLCPLIATFGCAGLPLTYITPAFEATVVDADTGQPIEGAVVVANWQVVEGLLHGTRDMGSLETKETVTDKNGRFHFDETSVVNSTGYSLRNQDPQIFIFKPGYQYFSHRNRYSGTYPELEATRIRAMQLSGRTIRLESTGSDLRKRGSQLSNAAYEINPPSRPRNCDWKYIPKMAIAIDKESRYLQELGAGYYGMRIELMLQGESCASALRTLKELMK